MFTYMKWVFWAFLTVFVYGVLCPTLVSMANTEAFVAGAALAVLYPAFFYFYVFKNEGSAQ